MYVRMLSRQHDKAVNVVVCRPVASEEVSMGWRLHHLAVAHASGWRCRWPPAESGCQQQVQCAELGSSCVSAAVVHWLLVLSCLGTSGPVVGVKQRDGVTVCC